MKRDYINKANFDLFGNTSGVLSKIAEFEVAEYATIETRTDEPFNLFLAYKEEFGGTLDLSPSSWDADVTGDIPNTPQIPDDGGIAVAYVSTDGSTWTREDITNINYWDADSNTNRITVDTDSYSTTNSGYVRVYYLFVDGQVVIQASPPKGEYETVESLIGTYPVSKLHRRSQFHDEVAPYFSKQRKYPGDWNLYIKLDSSAKFDTDSQDLITKIEFPVNFYESGETVPKRQLEDELVQEILRSR